MPIPTEGLAFNVYDRPQILSSGPAFEVGVCVNLILTVSILDHIDPGMDKDLFVKDLQNKIYFELDKLG